MQHHKATSAAAQRTVHSVEFVSPNIATVRTIAEFDAVKTRLSETYALVKDDGQWKIRVHEVVGAVYR